MLKFEWNALRIGDHLRLHDPAGGELPLLAGTVTMIETTRSRRDVNRLGIRVATGGGHQVLWPSYLAVHHEASDGPDPDTGTCSRCVERVEPLAGA
jgi:hypothetical protein